MTKMVAAQDGSAADREKAVTGLIVGVKMLQDKVAEHMRAMKDETQELNEGAVIVDSAPRKKGPSVMDLVERFDQRGTEPNELFRSEFGQNSCKIQKFSVEKV